MTRNDNNRNEHIRGSTRVMRASKKVMERRLNWYGHMMRRGEEHTYRGECQGWIHEGKVREDDRKQDGKTRANDI